MNYKGKICTNPANGEYFEVVTSAEETNGAYSTIKVLIKPNGFRYVNHKHLEQDETFEVIAGRLTYILDGKQSSIGPGEKITLPKGIAHTHFNDGAEDLLLYQTASPALDFEPFLVSLAKLVVDGKVKNGQPPFLQLMIWMNEMKGKTCVANIPIGVQKFLAAVLAPIGKLAGYRIFYQ